MSINLGFQLPNMLNFHTLSQSSSTIIFLAIAMRIESFPLI